MDNPVASLLIEARRRAWWRPVDRTLYDLFLSQREQLLRQSGRVGLWMAVCAYVSFAIVDFLLIPDVALRALGLRLAVGASTLAVLEVQYLRGVRASAMNVTCASAIVAGAGGWLLVATGTQFHHALQHYLVFGAIFMMGANLFFAFRPPIAILASGTVLAVFLAAVFAAAPGDLAFRITQTSFLACCFALSSYLAWRLDRERFAVFVNETDARLNESKVAERGRELLRMANTDSLTGLRNRRAMERAYEMLLAASAQDGRAIGVILLDVDFFKKYNDLFGHQKGDRCLVRVGETIEAAMSAMGGMAGRYGGEEFIAFCRVRDETELRERVETLRAAVEGLMLPHPERKDGCAVVTASVGASITRRGSGVELDRMANEADWALYRAKSKGRNCAVLFDPSAPMHDHDSEHVAALLRVGLERGLVSLVYQPIFDVTDGTLVATETLMRLRDLDGKPVSPATFIPIAEETGAIVDLGLWAIETACRDIVAADRAPLVSVNISAVQLRAPGFPLAVAAAVARSGARPGRLALEITESFDITLDTEAQANIAGLRRFGVQVWLDDFGTGFAGLAGLRKIPFDMVKLDHSFLAASHTPEGVAFLEDIVRLVHNCGFEMVIEGVETEEQVEMLRRLGTPLGQGYHLGRPSALEPDEARASA